MTRTMPPDTHHTMMYSDIMEKKTTLYLPDELQRELQDAAHRTGLSQAEIIRVALRAYLDRDGRPAPRSVGMVEDGGVPAAEAKAWIRGEWSRS
jgi:predicted transcriptional regulator